MKKTIGVVFVVFAQVMASYGQPNTISDIEEITDRIDQWRRWEVKSRSIACEQNAEEHTLDVYHHGSSLKKLVVEKNLSSSRLITTIYFDHDLPIRIVERLEELSWQEDITGFTKLDYVIASQNDIYVLDWERNLFKTVESGNQPSRKSKLSDYCPYIGLGRQLLRVNL